MTKRINRRVAAAAAFACLLPAAAWAQADFPNKPLKLISPFPAGGTSDVMARMIAEELGKQLKQPVVVENIGGAGGVIGTDRGLKAAADGYTLIQTGVGQNAVAHGISKSVPYDSNRDFIHLTQVHSGPNVLVAHPSAPFNNFQEFLAYGRANPGKLNYGYTPAASGHMAMELLKQTASTCVGARKENCKPLFMVGIPYRGGGPMMVDLLGGQIPVMFINQDVALQHVKAGKLKALAVSSLARNPLYPDVPTIHEAGFPGFSALSWSGISVAKGTPKPVADKLEAALVAAMSAPAIRQRMESQGFVVPQQGSHAYTGFVARELDRWPRVIKVAGIKEE
ncbi:tripartite tricarboxylate transporter substrate binding protein [Caenimonas sedimenti]|uniref:Tripartite tricarboxylate transporter substrate binding protein n=1 Tax=Caenimonas sedimenti TaxID=2596921 RepID=A0A562ZMT7_9BURK|nr:tripartite tricarboxylate transporter substrate binding protein [Caenimonas sedimenti]TWO69902.1 tripartite tricarboxylate transporter substrate binding protein [Caenimonas sedimenti]